MKEFWNKVRRFFGNKWVKFSIVTLIYVLWFVVWAGNLWMLLGIPVIFDIYITKYIQRALFGKKHQQRKATNKAYKEMWSWIEAILFAVIAASLIHTFVFQMYRIPTSSMEKTLLVGDYLFVSKVTYGPRMPMTPLSFPLVHNSMPLFQKKKSYSEAIRRPFERLCGIREIERGDIVVFNFPAGDTVLQEQPNVTYYDVLRDYQANYGERRGREELNKKYNVISHPVDKRDHYVKRLVGMPGDTLSVISGNLYIDSNLQEDLAGRQYMYFVNVNGTPISDAKFDELGVAKDDRRLDRSSLTYVLPLTDTQVEQIKKMSNVIFVERYVAQGSNSMIFPNDSAYSWNEDNFGPLWIPFKGATVELTTDNLPLYMRIIKNYEGNDIGVRDGVIYINGKPAMTYTFKMNYYFMMGDNRHSSADSRFWGFVPEDHIVGTPSFVTWSVDKDKSLPSNIRWNRVLKSPK